MLGGKGLTRAPWCCSGTGVPESRSRPPLRMESLFSDRVVLAVPLFILQPAHTYDTIKSGHWPRGSQATHALASGTQAQALSVLFQQ